MLKARELVGISIFWLALSLLTDGMNTLLLPAVLLTLAPADAQATTLGFLSFTGLLAGMLIQPLAGAWSDRLRARWGRRGMLALGVGLILLALAVFGAGFSLAFVIIGYLLAQISSSVAQAAQQGFIPDKVPPAQRGQASGWKGVMDLTGAMLGFVLLGALLGSNQVRLALAVTAAVLLVAFLLTLLLAREPRAPADQAVSRRPSLTGAYRLSLREHPAFASAVAARFLFLTATYAVGRFLLLFVAERLGLDPVSAAQQAAGLLAGLSLVTVLFAVPAGRAADRFGRVPVMVFGVLANAAGILFLIPASSSAAILAAGGLMSLGSAAFSSANWAITTDLAPPAEGGRFLALANFGTAGAAAAAGLFGPLVDAANRAASGAGFPLLFVLAALVSLSSLLALSGLRAPHAEPTA